MTLTALALGRPSLAKQAALVLAGTLVIALAAQVSVPFFPVPMTLQTLAILLVGFAFGARLGAITLLTYLGQGLVGLPVFANGMNGVAFAGPTAGFLVGFVLMAWIAGLATDRGVTSPLKLVLVALAASVVLYVPGLAWPLGIASAMGLEAGWAALPLNSVLSGFMMPFLLGDVAKAVLAALLIVGATRALRGRA
jgi:biotin transport system substrate-specific component